MKYVIKNCDNYTDFDKDWTCRSTIQNRKGCYNCYDCTDCLLKQIVQVCNEYSDKWEDCDFSNGLSEEILKLLDIQEIE